jgi:hypothetical protein
MSASACERVYRRILSDNYKDRAYRNIDDFVVDVAAIAKKFPAVVASAAGQLLTSPHEQTWCATGKCKSQAACCCFSMFCRVDDSSLQSQIQRTSRLCCRCLLEQPTEAMVRKTDKDTTVLASLRYATTKQQLGYLRNASIFVLRNPGISVMYGTTNLEAFQNQLKSWFRNVFFQTSRNAKCVCQAAAASADVFALSATCVVRAGSLP